MLEFGLKESIIAQIRAVFEKHPTVEKVIIYGSRAMGNYKNGSDIDLTMVGKNISDRDKAYISSDLDDLPMLYTCDLSILKQIGNPDLVDHINRVGKIFYERRS